jgi:hypothetical protein
MTCEQIRDWLGPYLDDEVSADIRGAVEAHASACRHCARELESLRSVADVLAQPDSVPVPTELWGAIEGHLPKIASRRHPVIFTFRRVAAVAAVLLIAVGVGLFTLPWGWDEARNAQAATIDFGVLLDAAKVDVNAAFEKFLQQYGAKEIPVAEAKKYAPRLSFDLPEVLPGGFRLEKTYALRFGDNPAIASRYLRDGELLGVIFHPPVLKEQFGTHQDQDCVVGKHRGHAVAIGDWTLVHVTDPTTCHCVLSRLDHERELSAILPLIAPGSGTGESHGHTAP